MKNFPRIPAYSRLFPDIPAYPGNGRPLRLLPSISVLIAGDTGQLIHLRQEDSSYSMRPAALVKDMDKLLAIPDEEFLKYTPEQRSNLVSEFAAVQYPPITNRSASTNRSQDTPLRPAKGK